MIYLEKKRIVKPMMKIPEPKMDKIMSMTHYGMLEKLYLQ